MVAAGMRFSAMTTSLVFLSPSAAAMTFSCTFMTTAETCALELFATSKPICTSEPEAAIGIGM